MLLNNANDILSKSYSKLGDLAIARARNMANGYAKSNTQRKLYIQARMIELNLGSLFDHLQFNDNGSIVKTLRTNDAQVNRFLKVLESAAQINNYATAPVLTNFPKKRYILKNQEIAVTPTLTGVWTDQGYWDGSFNTFPLSGASGDSIKKGYTWEVSASTTTLLGPDGGIIPVGATIRALIDSPGQTLSNWKIMYS